MFLPMKNRAKGNLTPYEFLQQNKEVRNGKNIKIAGHYLALKNKAQYPNAYRKFKHFVSKKDTMMIL